MRIITNLKRENNHIEDLSKRFEEGLKIIEEKDQNCKSK